MKFKYIIPLILIFCIIFSSVVSAEESSEKKYCVGELIPGDEYFLMVGVDFKVGDILVHRTIDYGGKVTSSNAMMCLYLSDMSTSPTGYTINEHLVPQVNTYREYSDCGTYNTTRENTSFDCKPCEYNDPYYTSYSGETKYFITNIPIFQTYDEALAYSSGELGVEDALNYKKVFENGSYVSPFEDIEINDSNIPTPELSNVSHNGFTVTNAPDERYMVDVYMESGIQNPLPYEKNMTSIGDALFVNSFGLVSDSEGAYTGTIDILACYGIDNLTALDNSKNSFYSTYVDLSHFNDSLYSIGEMGVNQKSWSIWGAPFGKKLVFFTKYTYPEASEFQSLSIYKMPLCYTNYKVRYFYFDEESGMHYGPWTNFIYFSDGRVFQSSIYEDNNGNVIDTPLQSGSQDSEGNVSINNSPGNLIELENPNELFGYLRSVLNNMNATNNTFSQLFGSVFNFLPPEILAIIFGGIAAMVFIGIVKAVVG